VAAPVKPVSEACAAPGWAPSALRCFVARAVPCRAFGASISQMADG
jgi:hypothetical protein